MIISEDPRLTNFIQPVTDSSITAANVVILGVPTDEGIRRNGGRVGASKAPAAIREWLGKLTPFAGPHFKHHLDTLRIVDLGDITQGSLETMHEAASKVVSDMIAAGKIIIAIGGGHDVTYPLVRGFQSGLSRQNGQSEPQEIGLINFDAHLDVRPKKNGQHHSGSSFRLLLEEGIVKGQHFAEIGIQSFVVAQAQFEWVLQQGARILTFEDTADASLPNAFEECEFAITHGNPEMPVYLSFDMDSVRASDAPGVSAPTPIGFLAEEAYELSVAAGLSKNVRVLDLVEVSPPHDLDGRTSRLAARMIAGFLAGVANREIG
ncbi:MAG: formimidoylglutamase [Bacteroidota bacterium]|nr:formimidoylglutamase [Bacteroidota bacterium]MDP4233344.1 formimidoylglutamase [Bacteroidota bacterium]MDP4242211.1 formimidoylglutamase [Bacteroidota bacterium]MDP4286967.1 formimidoylglutamase [Bacteroidota bacterium]